MIRPDTIAALATPPGVSALAVVRVSGPDAVAISERCFRGSATLGSVSPRSAQFGRCIAGSEVLDQVVVTVFRAPSSATGEDLVEFSCHGGSVASRRILDALMREGALPARPGEFTERAFVNGKLDLAQAEAVAEVIHASSVSAQRVAVRQLEGRYSELLDRSRQEIIDAAAFVELELDFGEEDVEFADRSQMITLCEQSLDTIEQLLGTVKTGERVRGGVVVVLAGRPNAGKSTLLNKLVGRERVIVSSIPGTTRDTVEVEAEISGMLVRFVDTAGVRETSDEIEALGVQRSRRSIGSADILLYIYDGTVGLEEDELSKLGEIHSSERILIANKADAMSALQQDLARRHSAMVISAFEDKSVALIHDAIERRVADENRAVSESAVVMHDRHIVHLRRAKECLGRALRHLRAEKSGDLLALDLKAASDELGSITGEITNEDVLSAIFSRFCIGK